MKQTNKKTLTLKTLNKSNVWDVQENDIVRMWAAAEKDADLRDNMRHYLDVIKSAFSVEEVLVDRPEVIKKYEARDCKIAQVRLDENTKIKWAIKKKPILRITDLTYENIHHISAVKLIEVLDRNFGGGWESIPQSIRDIIESGFDISTTTLPQNRLKKKGGLYEKKIEDGYEVLEIPKGLWVEAIFVKEKPEMEIPKRDVEENVDIEEDDREDIEDDDDDMLDDDDHYNDSDEDDDDEFDEEKLTEESYRTTFETDPEDLELAAEGVADDDDY